MTIDEIKELIRVVEETGIAELEVKRGDNTVRIRRSLGSSAQDVVLPTVFPLPVTTALTAAASAALPAQISASSAPAPTPPADDERNTLVKSPIVGTYYDSPSPGSAPFVKVGDVVHPKQVLCIIESMKLMNEIEADMAGTVVSKFVENGRPVEYGESLFSIRAS